MDKAPNDQPLRMVDATPDLQGRCLTCGEPLNQPPFQGAADHSECRGAA